MAEKKDSRNKNTVADNQIWVETVKKERRTHQLNENFTLNPRHLELIAEKPTASRIRTDEEPLGEQDELSKSLAQVSRIPREKYPFPATSSQEIGWDLPEAAPSAPRWDYSRSSCTETKYATAYVTMAGVSPYSVAARRVNPNDKK
eukprot:GILI01004827.1.p1 GENE.GILI01004827.1~~GILI01004827.1.p1  ORF type:complete len:146 (+),score=12.35 GILI01004827.1:74-511(+)